MHSWLRSKGFFCLTLLVVGGFAPLDAAPSPTKNLWKNGAYLLALSEARNAHELGNLDDCVRVARRLIHDYPSSPEAYHLLGRIHLEKSFYRVALRYFEKAIEFEGATLVDEERCDLYLSAAAAAHYLGNQPRQRRLLSALKSFAGPAFERTRAERYRLAVSEASFALGLLAYRKGEFFAAQEELVAALAAKGPYQKLPYLLLAAYYGRTSAEVIEREARAHDPKRAPPNKVVMFFFYRDRYRESGWSPAEKQLLEDDWLRAMVLEMKSIERSMSAFER